MRDIWKVMASTLWRLCAALDEIHIPSGDSRFGWCPDGDCWPELGAQSWNDRMSPLPILVLIESQKIWAKEQIQHHQSRSSLVKAAAYAMLVLGDEPIHVLGVKGPLTPQEAVRRAIDWYLEHFAGRQNRKTVEAFFAQALSQLQLPPDQPVDKPAAAR